MEQEIIFNERIFTVEDDDPEYDTKLLYRGKYKGLPVIFKCQFNGTRESEIMEHLENSGVSVPKLYGVLPIQTPDGFCESVIVMEDLVNSEHLRHSRIEGLSFEERKNIAVLWLGELQEMYAAGFMHGDPHSGNAMYDILTGVITLIDFDYSYSIRFMDSRYPPVGYVKEQLELNGNESDQSLILLSSLEAMLYDNQTLVDELRNLPLSNFISFVMNAEILIKKSE